ncbi:MAG: autotransporter-associated beta strand repeat-containing protein [Planctomycetes bacterium]|nr:autotransporter-associated beta strand repeat-containing protein [Planctomycetota bacterium]
MNASAALSRHPRSFARSLAVRTWLACVAAVLVTATPARAAIYTYTSAFGSSNWSAGTNWGGGTAPVSGTTTSLVFTGSQGLSAAVNSNNNTGTFVLTDLTFSGTGPNSGIPPTYTILGNPLDFTIAGGTSTLLVNSQGNIKPVVRINTNLIIDATQLTVSGNGGSTNVFVLGGTVSGTGTLAIRNGNNTGGTYYTGSTAGASYGLSPSNSYSGGFWFQQGTLNTSTTSAISDIVGMTGSNSMFGSAGPVILGNGVNAVTVRLNSIGTSGSTDRTIIVGGTVGTTITLVPTTTVTFGMGAITSGTGGDRSMTLGTSGASTANFDVGGLVSNGTDGSVLSVRFNGSGNGTLYLRNPANSFGGGVSIAGNTAGKTYVVSVAKIGNSGSTSPLGTSGTITIGGATGGTNMLTWTGTAAETTDKVVNLASTASGNVAAINNTGSGLLKFTSDVVSSGGSNKNFNFYGTGTTEFSGRIVDNGAFTTGIRKGDAGVLILSGSNTYTGLTDINNGTLQFANNSLNNTSGVRWSSSTGVLQWGTGNTQDISPKIQMTTGNWSIVDTNGNNVTLATSIGGTTTASFNKRGLGTLTLSASNSWTGSTVVDAGVLNFASISALGSGTGSGSIRISSGTLQYGTSVTNDISDRLSLTAGSSGAIDTNGNNVTFANPVASTGTGNGGLIKAGVGSLTLQASSTYSLGTSLLGGSLVAGNVEAFGSGAVTVTNGTLDLGGYNVANAITVNGGSLSNASNYTGVLAIGGTSTVGTASLAGSIGTGVTVNAGSTLNGTAVFAGSIAGAGLVGPGSSSAGILSASSLNPAAGGSFAFEFTQAAPDYTQVLNSGNDILKLTGGSPFASSLSSGNAVNIYFTQAAVGLGTLTGGFFTSNAADFASSISGATFNYYVQSNSGTVSYNGQTYQTLAQYDAAKSVTISTVAANGGQVMQLVVVPEPSSVAILAGVGMAIVLLRSRRRHA